MSRKQRGATILENAAILLFTAVIALPGLRLLGELTESSYLQANFAQEAATAPAFFFEAFTGGHPASGLNIGSPDDANYALQGGGSETNNHAAGGEMPEQCRPSPDSDNPCGSLVGEAPENRP